MNASLSDYEFQSIKIAFWKKCDPTIILLKEQIQDKITPFAARIYESDEDCLYVSGVIPAGDKVNFYANSSANI